MSDSTTQGIQNLFVLSGGIGLFILFLGITWWLLCIILFFKVWGMTNNIKRMKDIAEEQLNIEHPYVEQTNKDQTKELPKNF
jgi:hypothetical protein